MAKASREERKKVAAKGKRWASCRKINTKMKFIWNYHVKYFFKTVIRRNPDSCVGYDLYLIDRCLYQIIPLTYSSKFVGCCQKIFILGQIVWAITTEWKCSYFHAASLKWVHDALFTLWEIILWSQIPIFYFFHVLSVRFKTDDKGWLHMVRAITWFLLFLTLIVIVISLVYIPDFPQGLMESAWKEDEEKLDKPDHRPAWIMNMQRPLECCGFREPTNWIQGKSHNYPYTCCPITTYDRNCSLEYVFRKGCLWKVSTLYGSCKPIMWKGGLLNVLVLVINYGLFRYLFKRNYQGWQIDMTWHEAFLPVLKVEHSQLPLRLKVKPRKPFRRTESEAFLDLVKQGQKAMSKAQLI